MFNTPTQPDIVNFFHEIALSYILDSSNSKIGMTALTSHSPVPRVSEFVTHFYYLKSTLSNRGQLALKKLLYPYNVNKLEAIGIKD